MTVTIDEIRAAAELIRGQVLRTPMIPAPRLSALTGAEVFVKYENLQVTNSFKDRGALVKIASLGEDERKRGVVAMSAGNHAQAVAYHATRLGIPATIVMPEHTPFVKVGNTEVLGARVVLHGETLSEAGQAARKLEADEGLTFVHPYDDPLVISGQGTVGLEIHEDVPDLDCVVVPIGGGGLISGVALALAELAPDIAVYGVEHERYPCMTLALDGKKGSPGGATIAEGIAVKDAGQLNREIVANHVKEIFLVDEATVERAINAFLTVQKTMAEGAGASGLAALLANRDVFRGKRTGIILCGGNIDPRILASIMVRELEREDRIVSLRLTIEDQPGMLGRIATCLGEHGANILEVSHRRLFLDIPAKNTSLDVMIETKDAEHARAIIKGLEATGFSVTRLEGPAGRELASD